jgi:hypothetical protein
MKEGYQQYSILISLVERLTIYIITLYSYSCINIMKTIRLTQGEEEVIRITKTYDLTTAHHAGLKLVQ